jgi:hypothetical protein
VRRREKAARFPEGSVNFWAFLNHWWNLPSLVMLGLVGTWFGLQTVGLIGQGDSDVEGDADTDVDAGAEHEIEADHDVAAEADHDLDADAAHDVGADHDADADHDAEGDHDSAHESSSTLATAPGAASHSIGHHGLAGFLGMGRVPFMVVWVTLFTFTGFTDLLFNRILFFNSEGNYRGWFFPISFLASLVVGMFATRTMSGLAWKLVDVGGRGSTRRGELPGSVGVVASERVDGEHGEVRVKDARGNELIVHARVDGASHPKQGEQVVLLDYDEQRGLYTVAKVDEGSTH